jgi:hypothetical protein
MFNLDSADADGRVQDQSFAISYTCSSDDRIAAHAESNGHTNPNG